MKSLKAGTVLPVGTHIYGAFEAGFSSRQDFLIEGWGCTEPSLAYDEKGGLDINLAEALVEKRCGLSKFPELSGTTYNGIVNHCGGHTSDYHFHRDFACCGAEDASGHSTKIGQVMADIFLYGKWEDKDKKWIPALDACGAHHGVTPDSNGETVYHYHAQGTPPYSVGCLGPSTSTGSGMVGIEECRSLYPECSGSVETFETNAGEVSYMRDCPCYDANGSNTGVDMVELPGMTSPEIYFVEGSEGSSSDDSSSSGSTPSPSTPSTPSPASDASSASYFAASLLAVSTSVFAFLY
eukprot:CAMPEP_0197847832 /NCGR_PEP_ID=MMETSP1438-20131217/7228_1 /TAXON_ID=1461541 /ORGANISM="Pterosperma sp., Strain CCMP1384" /LENGTH=294 /DNA_ID=CAMNT_0043459869 /DNA_START=239 /DNA_END=1122 /DNA_ORIENTATION=+